MLSALFFSVTKQEQRNILFYVFFRSWFPMIFLLYISSTSVQVSISSAENTQQTRQFSSSSFLFHSLFSSYFYVTMEKENNNKAQKQFIAFLIKSKKSQRNSLYCFTSCTCSDVHLRVIFES